MADSPRTLRALKDAGSVRTPPDQLTKDEGWKMAMSRESFTVTAVDMQETEEFGIHWTLYLTRTNGERYTFGMWANPERDEILADLMGAVQDGPIAGVLLTARGSSGKPFFNLTAE